MLDVRHTTFAGKIFEQSLLIQYRVRFALLLIILGQPFIEGCNSIKIPDFRHFLTSFPSFIRIRVQWTACNIYPKTSFPLGSVTTKLRPCLAQAIIIPRLTVRDFMEPLDPITAMWGPSWESSFRLTTMPSLTPKMISFTSPAFSAGVKSKQFAGAF